MSLEQYTPSLEDRERLKPGPDRLKLSGDGVFATLQGEGVTAGEPAVFLRLHYCNLTCGSPEGWKCDTDYTWDKTKPEYWQEPYDRSFDEIYQDIEQAWTEKHPNDLPRRLVITGGEPLMQQKKIAKLIEGLDSYDIEIETNGTIEPIEELINCQFNCSPKLSNSGNSLSKRYKPEVLKAINDLHKSQFKFVVSHPSDLSEVDVICSDCNLNPEKIIIMPEGHTAEEVEQHSLMVEDLVSSKGWILGQRHHLIWFGNQRRT